MLGKKDYLFICDFETTGVDPENDYPIEIGGLFTDKDLNIHSIFSSLIRPPDDTMFICYVDSDKFNDAHLPKDAGIVPYRLMWKPEYQDAYKIHGIKASDVVNAPSPEECVEALLKHIKTLGYVHRLIITSDNAQFEYNFMKKLFKLAKKDDIWPFHYSAWDSSLSLELFAPDIGDAIPVHRALPDALRLYRQLVRYAERCGFFKL